MGLDMRSLRNRAQLRNRVVVARTRPIDRSGDEAVSASDLIPSNLLEEIALNFQGLPFAKWWHYFASYDEELGSLARLSRAGDTPQPLKVLEIGVWKGGSLDLWRSYFGDSAVVFGIDLDPSCASLPVQGAEIRIGSQVDRGFLRSVVDEMGGVDVVIDDGSHVSSHVIESFRTLFPLLADGGVYVVEDLHASYWPWYGGGLRRKTSSVEALKTVIDAMHAQHFEADPGCGLADSSSFAVRKVAFYESMAFLWKAHSSPALRFEAGSPLGGS
jgi:hypothetical protein